MATEMAVKLYCIEKLLMEVATLFPRLATILLSMNPALCEERFFPAFLYPIIVVLLLSSPIPYYPVRARSVVRLPNSNASSEEKH